MRFRRSERVKMIRKHSQTYVAHVANSNDGHAHIVGRRCQKINEHNAVTCGTWCTRAWIYEADQTNLAPYNIWNNHDNRIINDLRIVVLCACVAPSWGMSCWLLFFGVTFSIRFKICPWCAISEHRHSLTLCCFEYGQTKTIAGTCLA